MRGGFPPSVRVRGFPASVGSGSLTDGGTVTISGTGWGTNPATQEFLGGSGGHLDSATPGADFSKSGWTPVSGIYVPRYSTTQTLTRSRSLAFDAAFNKATNPNNSAAFGVGWDVGSGVSQVMWTSYIYYGVNTSVNLTQSQQKFYRLMPTVDVTDTQPQRYLTHWRGAGGEGDGDAFVNPNNGGGVGSGYSATGTVYLHPTNGPNASRHPDSWPNNNTNEWYHVRLWHKLESSVGAVDGEFKLYVTRVSDGAVMMDDLDFGVRDYIDATRVRYWIMQHYFGNAVPQAVPGGSADNTTTFETPADGYCYEDDCYLAYGSDAQKFLLVGNASTYAACTKFATQPWSSWSNTSITFNLNKGPHASLSGLYAYPMQSIKTPFSTSGIAI